MSNLPPNQPSFNTEAIQLRLYPFGESDQIVVMLSREQGVLRAIAKGARRAKSKLSGNLAPLRCSHFQLYRGKSLHRVTQVQGMYAFSHLQRDYDRLMCGLAMAELLVLCCQEQDPQPELYDAVLLTLETLNHTSAAKMVLLWFLLYFLENQGYAQDWDFCQLCELEFRERDYRFFDLQQGGLRCEDCKQAGDRYLNGAQVAALQTLQQAPAPTYPQLSEQGLNSLLWSLQALFQHLIQQELKAFAFLYPDQGLKVERTTS